MRSRARQHFVGRFRERLDAEAHEILRASYEDRSLDDAADQFLHDQAATPAVPGVRRRSMLKGMGAAALLAPFVDGGMFSPSRAHAQAEVDNLLIVTWPCGLEKPWEPAAGPLSAANLGPVDGRSTVGLPILEPLTPYLDRLLLATGMGSANTTGNLAFDHGLSTFGMWTGNSPGGTVNGGSRSPSESFEQIIREKISAGLSFGSLHVGVHAYGSNPVVASPYVHYAGPSQPINPENNTRVVFDQLVQFVGTAPADAGPDPALEAIKAEKRSVLDFITGRIGAVRNTLDADGQQKLDAHLEHVRALEVTLANRGTGTCALSEPPMPREEVIGEPFDPVNIFMGGRTSAEILDFENHVADQINTLMLAFQCGLTKVGTMQLSNTDCRLTGPNFPTSTHGAAHFGTHEERMWSTIYWTRQLRHVLDLVNAVPAGDGQTMLDKTLVVLASEMGIPEHGGKPPFMIIGGSQGYFKRGEHVVLNGTPQPNRLMLTLMDYFGIAQDRIGNAEGDVTGLLTEIMA